MKVLPYLYILTLSFLVLGCSYTQHNEPKNEDMYLNIAFGISKSETKPNEGEDILNENRIDRVTLLIYSGQYCAYFPEESEILISDGKMKVRINDELEELFDNVTNYTLVVIANCTIERSKLIGITLDQLKRTIISSDFSKNEVKDNFVMFGSANAILSLKNPTMGEVQLERLACKVRLSITSAEIRGYKIESAYASLISYTDKANLNNTGLNNKFECKSTQPRRIDISSDNTKNKTIPFYSYPNDWNKDIQRASYMLLTVVCTNLATNVTENYYYQIPFLVTQDDIAQYADKLIGNYFYNFNIKINKLGSKDVFVPITPEVNFSIMSWSEQDVYFSINHYKYIKVEKNNFEIVNATTESIKISSNVDINILEVTAKSDYIDKRGELQTISYLNGQNEFPEVTYNKTTSTLHINSPVPNNYLTKNITVKVGNGSIQETINIQQHPSIVVTSILAENKSSEVWHNNNLYKIKVYSSYKNNLVIGDPTELSYTQSYTMTDETSNKMVAPEFVIGPQKGYQSIASYDLTRSNCSNYNESPYISRNWRMPTQAELSLISMIQSDPNSYLKNSLLENEKYWSARKYFYYDFSTNNFTSTYASDRKGYRCVYDSYKK